MSTEFRLFFHFRLFSGFRRLRRRKSEPAAILVKNFFSGTEPSVAEYGISIRAESVFMKRIILYLEYQSVCPFVVKTPHSIKNLTPVIAFSSVYCTQYTLYTISLYICSLHTYIEPPVAILFRRPHRRHISVLIL